MRHYTYTPQAIPRERHAPHVRTTPETELAVCSDYRAGLTLSRICVLRGVKQQTVYRVLDKYGVERRVTPSKPDEFDWREARFLSSLSNGISLSVAASLAGLSDSAANTVVARARACGRMA